MRVLVFLLAGASFALSVDDLTEIEGEQSRKILGSSVVTSVSVIMDTGNGSKAVFTDAVGKPIPKPSSASELASPIDLLNPDRYEFYTFDDNGDLIKRLMSLEEIQGIIATGDSDGYDFDSFTSLGYLPEKRVNDVVNNVQNVLKEEMETHKNPPDAKPMFDTPDVSDSWSMILPAVFGNSGEDIKPEKPIIHVTPDTIMIEPNMQNPYTMSTPKKHNSPVISSTIPIEQTIVTSPRSTTSISTPRSTTIAQISSRRPTVVSTSASISTPDKLITLKPGTTTEKIPDLIPATEMKPMISVEIYSNSKSTENPVDQLETENSPIVEIKPTNTTKGKPKPSYESKITTKKPLTTTNFATFSLNPSTETEIDSISASVIKENITKPPVAFVPFMSNSINYSTLTTTEIETTRKPSETTSTFQLTTQAPTSVYMPVLTTLAPEGLISTWRPKPFSTIMTEPPTITDEITFTTEKPQTTTDDIQPLISYDEQPQHDLPTLADILNLNKDIAQSEQTNNTFTSTESVVSGNLTIPSIVNGQKNKDDVTTTEYIVQKSSQTTLPERLQTTENVEEDLSTLSSEYFGTKNSILYMTQTAQQEIIETTTQLPLEQSMNNAQKISATELLDQLLFTTNIYEINTELAEKTTELQTFSNEDERFESSTQEESKLSEIRTEFSTTTEEFLIKVVENTEQPTTDRTLINSIEQILSQAIVNVDKTLARVNDTQKIQDVLVNSGMKNMSEVQLESATLTSDLIGLNFNNNEENEKTTELNMLQVVASDNSNILSDSVGSLLSQVYESNLPSMTAIEQVITTEKYPTITINTTVLPNRKTDDVTLTMNVAPITEKLETSTVDSNDKYTEKSDIVFEEQETTTQITMFEREKFTTNEPTTVSYVPLNPINTNVTNISDQNYVPHLINITIISSENANIIVRNRTKPAKADLSLEQVYNEEIKMNSSVSSDFPHENEWIELYNIDQTPTSTENEKLNIEKIPNEILKAEETMSPLYNNTEESKATTEYTSNDQQNFVRQSEIPESTSEELIELSTGISTTATDESFIPIKEISKIYERPTTIIIIKRTERPVLEESTTIAPIKQNYLTDINIDTTTILDEKNLDSTTYGKKEVEITESEIEKNIPTITEIIQDDISMESTTKIITEPSIEIIIGENNKPLIEQTKQSADQQITTPFDNENNNKNENENKTPQESSNIRINITNEKIQQNNLKTGIANNLPHNKPSQTEKFNKTELPTESKPESTWTLVPTIAPHSEEHNDTNYSTSVQHFPEIIEPPSPIDLVAKPLQGFGLEDSTSQLDADIYQFAQLCNELAFGFWKTVTNGISSARSVFVSPFGATSLLAMVFLGARGATSGEMNEILRLDDMVTFNPHLIFKNVSESINTDEQDSGVASSAIIRELFSDRSKGKLLPFYKERARAFYDGYVEEASFREIGDVIRRRTNLQVKKYTNGKMAEYLKDSSITARSPLAGVSVNIFQTDCSQASTDGRDGELHFVVLPSIRQRRLIPVPAVVYKSGFLAGYEPSLDATAVSLGTKDQIINTILVIPGQQGIAAPGDGLARLEKRLVESSFKKGAWSRLLRSLIPRPGLEVQIPRFSHKSIINATVALKKMGLHDLFDVEKADLRGLNGVANELFLSDMLQINSFATCGEKRIGDTHHSEIYPATASIVRNSRYLENYQSEDTYYRSDLFEEPRDYQRAFPDPLHDPNYLSLPLPLRPRQARVPEIPRLRFDRPFIYFVRHNPTGLILHMGRFNPRLLP